MSWRQLNDRRRTEIDGTMWIPNGPSSDISCYQVENTGGMTGPTGMIGPTGMTGPINNFGINQHYTTVNIYITPSIIRQNTSSNAIFISYSISIPSGTCIFYCDENSTPTTQASPAFLPVIDGISSGSIVVPPSYYYSIVATTVATVTLYILS